MKKFGMVFGVAAVAVVAGCKDPNYNRAGAGSQNAPRDAAPVEATEPAAPAQPVEAIEPSCSCPPGTRHETPCACGAADCACVVTPKPVKAKPAEPEFTVYVVQNGDYLAKISKRFNVTIASIKRLNSLKSDTIRIGQKLKIPGKVDVGEQKAAPAAGKAAPAKASAPFAGATKEYVVKGGDTLGGIAHASGINSRQLKDMNGLSSDVIRVGQKLKVPAEKVVKADGKKSAAKPADVKKSAPAKAAAKPAAEKKPAAVEAAPVAEPVVEPPAEAAPVEAAPAPAAPQTFEYTVQEGEDITSVVVKFGVSASEIRDLNSLGEGDELKAGQKIKLPAEAQQ